jgi:hypothetical protein|tara:strand:- start:1562 stop:3067 length:1506 start_codon:yes stop_codon:yes gene_type:complete
MAIDIPSLFRDVIETPEQRQQRQMLERLGQAQSFMAPRGSVAALANPLASATFMNIAESQDRVKENLGGMLGLDMRDSSQKLSDALMAGDPNTPEGLRDLSKQLQNIFPAQSLGLLQAADEREQAEKAAEAAAIKSQQESYLTQLKTMNELAEAQSRRDRESFERTEITRQNTERDLTREGLTAFVTEKLSDPQLSTQLQSYINRIKGGQYDTVEGVKLLHEELNPEDTILTFGNTAYNATTNKFLVPPSVNSTTGEVLDVSPKDYDPASIGRYKQKIKEIQQANFTDRLKFEKVNDAANILLPKINGEKWQAVTRDGETKYVSIPDSSEANIKVDQDLRALNNRNAVLNNNANAGLDAVARVRNVVDRAKSEGKDITGDIVDVVLSNVSGTTQYALSVETGTLEGIMALTGLDAARQGSAVGASGFGALSAPELQLLKDRVAALRVGSSYEQFMNNLSVIENSLKSLYDRSSIQLTKPQYLGLEPKPTLNIVDKSEISLQ